MAYQSTTLYSVSVDKVNRFWTIELDSSNARYRTLYGRCNINNSTLSCPDITNQSIIISEWTEAKGKNIGKINETTPSEQAYLEYQREITKKLKNNYYLMNNNTASFISFDRFEVMLAENYNLNKLTKEMFNKDNIESILFFQPKLDGVRCYLDLETLEAKSRNHNNFDKIEDLIKQYNLTIPDQYKTFILDGELYTHGKKMNQIISDIKVNPKETQIHFFDLYNRTNPEMLFSERYKLLIEVVDYLKNYMKDYINIIPTDYNTLSSSDDITHKTKLYHAMYANEYEGIMIRVDKPYQNKRTKYLMKYKLMIDREFTILDILEGEGNKADMAGSVLVKIEYTPEDYELFPYLRDITPTESRVNISASRDICSQMLINKDTIIGKKATIVFQGFTEAGKIRFGELKVIRDYE